MSKPARAPHVFVADPEYPHPADQHGRRVCRCGLVGQPGDAHHKLPSAPEDGRMRAAGEGVDR